MKTALTGPLVRGVGRGMAIIAIALAAGHLVQTLAQRHETACRQSAAKAPVNVVQLVASTDLQEPQAVSLVASTHSQITQATDTAPALPTAADPLPEVVDAVECAPRMHLALTAGAMVAVTLSAPCDGTARVVLRHAGLAVTQHLRPDGSLAVRVPAMEGPARFEVNFADGRRVMASLDVPELSHMKRFAVQWLGISGFVVHGVENGAQFGQAGDVSPSQPGMIPQSVGGGWLSLLGDAGVEGPLLAQVYTYPTDGTAAEIVVEAPVTAQSCGKEMLGQTLNSAAGTSLITELTVAMPDCSAVGEFLVLKNLAQDMKVASR